MEKIPPDELYGNRVHSWVLLIICENEIKFIEPSTGDICEVADERYLKIESLWNHLNYWVNMIPSSPLSVCLFHINIIKTKISGQQII